MGGKDLMCTEQFGCLMASNVHVWKETRLQPGAQASIVCRIAARSYRPLGVIEGNTKCVPVSASINAPDAKGRAVVRTHIYSKQRN